MDKSDNAPRLIINLKELENTEPSTHWLTPPVFPVYYKVQVGLTVTPEVMVVKPGTVDIFGYQVEFRDKDQEVDPDLPLVKLLGSDKEHNAWEASQVLDRKFHGQAADDFCYAVEYNSYEPSFTNITFFTLVKQGENDNDHWIWYLEVEGVADVEVPDWEKKRNPLTWTENPTKIIKRTVKESWIADGWCDYTGWDCQSGLSWIKVSSDDC